MFQHHSPQLFIALVAGDDKAQRVHFALAVGQLPVRDVAVSETDIPDIRFHRIISNTTNCALNTQCCQIIRPGGRRMHIGNNVDINDIFRLVKITSGARSPLNPSR